MKTSTLEQGRDPLRYWKRPGAGNPYETLSNYTEMDGVGDLDVRSARSMMGRCLNLNKTSTLEHIADKRRQRKKPGAGNPYKSLLIYMACGIWIREVPDR